jgi:acetyl-CoA C-acetyltransferase
LVLATKGYIESKNLKPLARIVSLGDAATEPKKFTIAPSIAIPIALKNANLSIKDISLFEINEAFSVVVLANQKVIINIYIKDFIPGVVKSEYCWWRSISGSSNRV